ncbi:DUF4405 domain-containing protein [Cypionkella sinensis]|uniref:DUF4405 domain-containing protein n=1 Tax=Cypionkella sinensis TaxID=1756043 RepID=A0ABV7J0U2_9RHOB
MTPRPSLRLVLDLTAACLLVASLAYWWLGNTAHELFGTGLFLLMFAHNGFNRRWYGRLGRTGREPRGKVTIALNLTLMVTMIALLITSIVVSRVVFGFLPLDAGVTSRQLHLLAAYWEVLLVGLHIGLNWQIVINIARSRFDMVRPSSRWRALAWVAVLCITGTGLHSAYAMDLGAKLLNQTTLEMWDFNTATPRFFLNWFSILGMCAVMGHQGAKLLRRSPVHAKG